MAATAPDISEFLLHFRHGEQCLNHFQTHEAKLQAKSHFHFALVIAAVSLRSAVLTMTKRGIDANMIQSLIPLYESAFSIHKKIETINYSLGVFFDKQLAEVETVLFAFRRIILNQEKSQKTSDEEMTHKCEACSSISNLEEDNDNPGVFYCWSCWQDYDEINYNDENLTNSRLDVTSYSLEELLSLKMSTLSNSPIRFQELGFKDEESLTMMLQSLPMPYKIDKKKHNKKKGQNQKRKKNDNPSNSTATISLEESSNPNIIVQDISGECQNQNESSICGQLSINKTLIP